MNDILRERLVRKRLPHEGGNRTSVVRSHFLAVGVENTTDVSIYVVCPVVGHGDRLGEALGLVVDAADADGVDVAPVVFALRMAFGVAVDFAGAGEEKARALCLGQAE